LGLSVRITEWDICRIERGHPPSLKKNIRSVA
jgi:hypothetical protein